MCESDLFSCGGPIYFKRLRAAQNLHLMVLKIIFANGAGTVVPRVMGDGRLTIDDWRLNAEVSEALLQGTIGDLR